ncbi:PAS domain-containing protein [Neorhizobium sp. NCHU2750]|uniref:PAS domain-containing protein n=1 Tax=Neorhizobium sp. NCHU2750 TaxID=1825976 RepID=UPI000E724853|nr:hypothetical protein NCHU2750_58410 [Neorhizobium sp. NCHU2750]
MDTLESPPLVFLDADRKIAGWTEGATRILGRDENEVVGTRFEALRAGTDWTYRRKDGSQIELVVSSAPVPGSLQALALRSTARMNAQEQLELTLTNSDVIGSWDWNVTSDNVYADARFANTFGVDPVEAKRGLPLDTFVNGILEADRPRVSAEIQHTLQTGEAFRCEYRVRHADGSIRDVIARGRLVAGKDGQATRFPGVLFDITGKRAAERAAAKSDLRYRSLFDAIDAGFCVIRMIWDEAGKPVDYEFIEINRAFVAQTGIEDGVGRRMRDIAPNHEQYWFDIYGEVARSQQKTSFVHEAAALGFFYEVQAFPTDGPGSDHVAILFSDRSEQRKFENALKASEAEFRTLSQSMMNHVWIANAEGIPTWFNDRAYEYSGVEAGGLTGQGLWPLVHAEDLPKLGDLWKSAMASGGIFQAECRIMRVDGAYRWHLVRGVPITGEDGTIQRWVGTNTDIDHAKRNEAALATLNATLEERIEERTSELLRSRRALEQAQKMETLGQLTGGVAHDFNNLLQVIGGNLHLLVKDVAGNERAERRVTNALGGVSRGAKLASQLLAFGRRQPLEPKVVNLGRFLVGMEDLLRRSIGEAVEVEVATAGGLWNTFADPTQVENAVLNLAINARDAMEGTGRLTIEASNAFLDQDYASTHDEVEPGQYVMIAVSDTGSGMSPEIIEKVFEPFFSTKPEGKGTGLGLSMVYGFVKQSGGHVKIYSEVGQGTTVRIYLPRALADEDREVVINKGPIEGGQETILVVEDDEDVRGTVVEMLGELGYRVLTAKDAQAGLTVVESGIPIDVVFTDVVMPGPLKSREMARRAKERLPNLIILFTSGYTENSIVHGGRLDAGVELLSKPYTREALARRLRHLINNQKQREQAVAQTLSANPIVVAPTSGPSLNILLVEDDILIRMNTAEMLMDIGHQVVEAGSGGEALHIVAKGGVDLLVTDLGLPDMRGGELVVKIRELFPDMGVILATGENHKPDGAENAVLLSKPYDEDALRLAIGDAQRTSRDGA